jgi:hypothetical protein
MVGREPRCRSVADDGWRLQKMPSADVVADSAEGEQAEKPVAALVKYLNERKPRDKSKVRLAIASLIVCGGPMERSHRCNDGIMAGEGRESGQECRRSPPRRPQERGSWWR